MSSIFIVFLVYAIIFIHTSLSVVKTTTVRIQPCVCELHRTALLMVVESLVTVISLIIKSVTGKQRNNKEQLTRYRWAGNSGRLEGRGGSDVHIGRLVVSV